jgi:transposase
MRGTDQQSGTLFSYVDIEARVPGSHALRRIRELVNTALAKLDERFARLYSAEGRPSIPPERLIRVSHAGTRPRLAASYIIPRIQRDEMAND